jgi:predicted O-methyltransferase YrrM
MEKQTVSIKSLFNNPKLNQYIDDNSIKLDRVAEKLFNTAKNDESSMMLSSPNQLQLMSLLIKMSNVKNILEVGVFQGFSTLVMAQALLADGKIEACDISYDYIEPYI